MSLVVITTVDSCGDVVLAPTVRAMSDDCWVVRQESGAGSTAAAIIAGAHWAATVAGRTRVTDATVKLIRTATTKQSVEMFAKARANAIEGDGIDARIDVRQDEARNL